MPDQSDEADKLKKPSVLETIPTPWSLLFWLAIAIIVAIVIGTLASRHLPAEHQTGGSFGVAFFLCCFVIGLPLWFLVGTIRKKSREPKPADPDKKEVKKPKEAAAATSKKGSSKWRSVWRFLWKTAALAVALYFTWKVGAWIFHRHKEYQETAALIYHDRNPPDYVREACTDPEHSQVHNYRNENWPVGVKYAHTVHLHSGCFANDYILPASIKKAWIQKSKAKGDWAAAWCNGTPEPPRWVQPYWMDMGSTMLNCFAPGEISPHFSLQGKGDLTIIVTELK